VIVIVFVVVVVANGPPPHGPPFAWIWPALTARVTLWLLPVTITVTLWPAALKLQLTAALAVPAPAIAWRAAAAKVTSKTRFMAPLPS
jgi:hypothetical protein